jgi:hypothetical protein
MHLEQHKKNQNVSLPRLFEAPQALQTENADQA